MSEAARQLHALAVRQVWAWEQLKPCSPADHEDYAKWKEAEVLAASVLEDLAEREASFELHRAADMRAVKRWQEATGRELVWPDKADLCVWLLEQLTALGWETPNEGAA